MNAAKTAFLLFLFGCFASGLSRQYSVYVITGWHDTSSRVQLRIIGANGQTPSHVLNPRGGTFKAYSKNVFTINDKDVGKITAVNVYLSSGSWYIRKIFIVAGNIRIFNYEKMVSSGWTTIGVKCTKGYKTGSNGICVDIDECKTTKPCKGPLATCHNTIGSYQCSCPRGYRESFGHCYDINECRYSKVCDYRCVNTPGSYRCECRDGYKLKEGKCVDIDECSEGTDNCDRASTECVNYESSFNCKCKKGYKWVVGSRTQCEINFCGARKPDNLTTLSPARCLKENANKEGDICTRGCVYGYELRDPPRFRTIRCEDGGWRGWFTSWASGYCVGRRCPALPKTQNAYYLPSSCGIDGGRYEASPCSQYCDNGYENIGDTKRHCQKDGTWTGSTPKCKRIWPDPRISCPSNIYVDLPAGKNTASVGSKWKLPQSNYKTITVSSPVGADGQYQFPAGETKVEWTVTNPDGKTDKCTQYVTITDKEPPKVVSCPSPTVFHPVYTKGPYHVTYKEPEFSDNVGVVRVDKTYVTKTYNHTGESYQYFTARDKAGNSARCKFSVAIGGTKCTRWPDDRGLPGTWQYQGSSRGQKMVFRICANKTISSNGHVIGVYRCDRATGKWFPNRVGDCVGYKSVNKTVLKCEAGYEIVSYKGSYHYCVQCGLGTYLKEGNCTMCAAGTYQDKRGQTTCNKCPSGTSSLKGDFICRDLCPAGTFSKDGMRPFCTLCPQGQYQDQQGQASCSVCPQNKFTNTKLGATSCQDTKPSNQQQNGLLEISSIVKPKAWDIKGIKNTLECKIKDNSYKLVSVQWKIVNKDNIPVDFLGKPKFEETRNDAGKLVGSRLVLEGVNHHNARLDYVCVATNVNGEIRKTVNVPWPLRD